MLIFLFFLALIELIAWLIPASPDFKGIENYLSWHNLLEGISIVISMMVFGVGWNTRNKNLSTNVVLLASVFFSIGLIDFFHMASYDGMPDFFSPNDAQKHLNYWLAARICAAIVLLIVALRNWTPLAHWKIPSVIFVSFVAIDFLFNWAVIYHQTWFPDTFIPGQGLTIHLI